MKKLKFTVYHLLFILAIIYSCKQNVTIKRYANGNIKVELQTINDSMIHKKSYNENGKITGEYDFINYKKNGIGKDYYENGNIEIEAEYKNDLQDGFVYTYYPDGKIKSKGHFMKGKPFGDTFFYYPDGKLEKYNCFDFKGENDYIIKYDILGNKTKEEGIVFSKNFNFDDAPGKLHLGEETVIKIFVTQPPNTKSLLQMGELKDGKPDILKEIPIVNNVGIIKKSFADTGRHLLGVIAEIRDMKSNAVLKDSMAFEIFVHK